MLQQSFFLIQGEDSCLGLVPVVIGRSLVPINAFGNNASLSITSGLSPSMAAADPSVHLIGVVAV
jgi:hypothetical protein